MISRSKRHGLFHGNGMVALAAMAILTLCPLTAPARAASRPQPPWHIESFCHWNTASAHRCLVRARQGILVVQLAEMASAPTVKWSEGVAVLASGTDDRSRQLRFFAPPQKLSEAFRQVRAYDIPQQLVAYYADGGVHVRGMFADGRDLAVLDLPGDLGRNTLQAHFEGRTLYASWRDRQGRAQQRKVSAQR